MRPRISDRALSVLRAAAAFAAMALALRSGFAAGISVSVPAPTRTADSTVMRRLPARPRVAPVIACADLVNKDFSGIIGAPARVQSATVGREARFPAKFCVVRGYVAPTIQFRLDLPMTRWGGRYLQGGCGGNCGFIMSRVAPTCDNGAAYDGSFAVGFEDSGHRGGDGVWALGGERVRQDFAFRAAHEFAIAAKAIIAAYYGRPPDFAYFQGCSDGGREAMAETQRYPADFNGVIAGSPAFAIAEAMERFIWEARWGNAGGTPVLDVAAVSLLHRAVLASCDALDGASDGQIDDPRRCHFDPGSLQCAPARRPPQCLSASQVAAVKRFYQGPVDRHGRHLYYGGEPYGSEMTWVQPFALSNAGHAMFHDTVEEMIFLNKLQPGASVLTWKFDAAHLRELARRGARYDARDADLRPFRAHGAKLILWQGFADPASGAYGLPDYYARAASRVGGLRAERRFMRLFLVPGVYHCAGGYVPYQEDFLGAMVDWVERKEAPAEVMAAAELKNGRVRERPVYAYPVEARYTGHGDVNDPRNFEPRTPTGRRGDLYRWAGERESR